jgi:tetratricopeptide (TPR) repeat protein
LPGNRQAFDQALKQGNQLVWDKAWDKAIAAYQAALKEFPGDPIALASAGFVYTQLKRFEEALAAYRGANTSQPNDPAIMSKLAEVQERLGLKAEAAGTFLALGDLHVSRKATDKAVQCWERAAPLDPGNLELHKRLGAGYEALGKTDLAVREYTLLAKMYQKAGNVDAATRATQSALTLAPRQTGLLRVLDEVGSAPAAVPRLPPPAAKPTPPPPAAPAPSPWDIDLTVEESEAAESSGGSPLEIARDKAMSDLAEAIFEDAATMATRATARGAAARLGKAEIDALIGQALDCQSRGQVEQAIGAYQRILEAVSIPAAHFNLGLLYQQGLRFPEAIEQFKQIVDHAEYALGSRFAIGECYRALGQVDAALENFLEVLKIVDLQTVRREQADDLIALYESLAESYTTKGDAEKATAFTNSLVEFLSNQGWEDKVTEARKRLDSLAEDGVAITLADLFTLPNAEAILQSISLSQEYARRGKYYMASDEIHRAIQRAPDYLPLHLRLAELLWNEGRAEEATLKLRMIANVYQARGDMRQGIAIYQRILRMAPMDTTTRSQLIKMLISRGEIDSALEEYMQLADTYYQLAQMDKARETYQEALTYGPRGSTGKLWLSKIYSCLGDIDMQRIDWRKAIQDYEQAKAHAPEDEKARVSLVELYYKVGQGQRAVQELDALLGLYKKSGKAQKMIAVLEDQVHMHPGEIPLRFRLARLYVEAKMKEPAIEQLDALGELQLQAGLKKEAAATIRGIIALNPPNIDDYKQILKDIGTSLLGAASVNAPPPQ